MHISWLETLGIHPCYLYKSKPTRCVHISWCDGIAWVEQTLPDDSAAMSISLSFFKPWCIFDPRKCARSTHHVRIMEETYSIMGETLISTISLRFFKTYDSLRRQTTDCPQSEIWSFICVFQNSRIQNWSLRVHKNITVKLKMLNFPPVTLYKLCNAKSGENNFQKFPLELFK